MVSAVWIIRLTISSHAATPGGGLQVRYSLSVIVSTTQIVIIVVSFHAASPDGTVQV
jgi:hypothetical protein